MRRHYLDNLRWATVLLVVLYHVIYMYNGVITAGVVARLLITMSRWSWSFSALVWAVIIS